MLYTLDITFTPTELEKKMNNMRDEASLGREDAAEPPCDKVVKKCAGEMIMFFTFFVSVIAVSFAMDATYKYGRPGTV